MRHHSSVNLITNSSTVVFSTASATDSVLAALRQLITVLNSEADESVTMEDIIDVDALLVLASKAGERLQCEDNECSQLMRVLPYGEGERLS